MKIWITRTERNVLTIHQSEPKKVIMDSIQMSSFG